jgi:hypothetical protein
MGRNVKKRVQRLGLDLVFLVGCAVLLYGLSLAWRPLGFIVGGAALAAIAFFAGYRRVDREGE